MELIQQLERWQQQAAENPNASAADMDVAKRLIAHGIEATTEIKRLRQALDEMKWEIANAPKGEVASFSGTGSWHVIKEDVSVIVEPMKGRRVALVTLPHNP
jgi:hypothetical protein